MTQDDISSQLKGSVYFSVAKMVEDQCKELDTVASPSFVASLVEIVYNQILLLGEDLESFAEHAGRSTINTSDMYMIARKNEVLTDALKEFEKELRQRK